MVFNVNSESYICQRCTCQIQKFSARAKVREALREGKTNLLCRIIGMCKIFECLECTFNRLVQTNIFTKRAQCTRIELFRSKHSKFSSTKMGIIQEMMSNFDINLKEATFKWIRETFAPNFKCAWHHSKRHFLTEWFDWIGSLFFYIFLFSFGF